MGKGKYDSIVIGGGPSGLTAGLYLARAKRSVLIIERIFGGGQTGAINEVVNYSGIKSIAGYDLVRTMQEQAESFGAEVINDEVVEVDAKGKTVKTLSGKTYYAKTIVFATGCTSKTLGLSGEERLVGRGVSYCATCDGNFYKGKTVAVVGNSAKAVDDAEYLSKIAKKTYLVSSANLSASGVTSINGRVTSLDGTPLQSITVVSDNGQTLTLECDCLFVAVGLNPATHLLAGQVDMDEKGFIKTNEECETSEKGVYAVGDIRSKKLRQIATAVADGAIASTDLIKYTKE